MVYDWDSLVVERESVIVGLASAVFCARSEPRLGDVPTQAEQDAFLAEYQDAAGRLFGAAEQTVALAAASWVTPTTPGSSSPTGDDNQKKVESRTSTTPK